MKATADESRRVAGEPCRRQRLEARRGTLSVLTEGEARRRGSRRRKKSAVPSIGRPPAQSHPAAVRDNPHDAKRADARANGGFGPTEKGPERQSQPDRAGGVKASRQDLGWHDEHARPAALALVPTRKNRRHDGSAVRLLGAA